ncbi:hypothetical protein C2G38_2139661 [Gigaspora rosea]|uniref:AMP-binding enzyme C-terminal domain-containing protein n=1 Tax=Gigaspora rosea TaxID=44941 RepID=A0A397VX93_9GLOM|nr:hypothetical protein C2G38_2139661 [Gigaspora rosea]
MIMLPLIKMDFSILEVNFSIIDRFKELIKYKEHLVSPTALEEILLTHPAVDDAAVIGHYSEQNFTELPTA